jgi:dolichyl-phosphate-mannose--protein O-mannosyl transferase
LSTLLLAVGIIPSPEANFPFGILEALFGIPALVLLVRWQRRTNTLRQVWIGFAVWSFVIEYLSRFFNDNYVVFIVQALVIAAFLAPTKMDAHHDAPAV